MSETKRIRVEQGPPVGAEIEMGEEFEKWVITSYEEDPAAIWHVHYYVDDEAPPEAQPQTRLAVLRKVES